MMQKMLIARLNFLSIITIGIITLVLSTNVTEAESQNNESILDGRIFIGHVGPKGRDANGEDEVIFQKGQFFSTSCAKYGFGSAPYQAHQDGNSITFTAVTRSAKHGQIDWQGTVNGEMIEASYTWTKERWYWFDANEENWFKGRSKNN